MVLETSEKTQNICKTCVQRRPKVFDVGPTLYKCHTNVFAFTGLRAANNDILWQFLLNDKPSSVTLVNVGYTNVEQSQRAIDVSDVSSLSHIRINCGMQGVRKRCNTI